MTTRILFVVLSLSWLQLKAQVVQAPDLMLKSAQTEETRQSVSSWYLSETGQIVALSDEALRTYGGEPFRITLPENNVKTVASKGGSYVAVLALAQEVVQAGSQAPLSITVYAVSAGKLYEIIMTQHYDEPYPAVAISDRDGAMIIGNTALGSLQFYDSNGALQRTIELFRETQHDLERNVDIDFSRDGSVAAVVAGKRGSAPTGAPAANGSADPHLLRFTPEGREIWRRALDGSNTNRVHVSDDGRFVAANSYGVSLQGELQKQTQVFDENGNQIAETSLLFKHADFSPDSQYLMLAENHLTEVVRLATGERVWRQRIDRKRGMIASVQMANGGKLAAMLIARSTFRDQKFVFADARLHLYDDTGVAVQELAFPDEFFQRASLYLTGGVTPSLFIGFQNAYHIYKVQ